MVFIILVFAEAESVNGVTPENNISWLGKHSKTQTKVSSNGVKAFPEENLFFTFSWGIKNLSAQNPTINILKPDKNLSAIFNRNG